MTDSEFYFAHPRCAHLAKAAVQIHLTTIAYELKSGLTIVAAM